MLSVRQYWVTRTKQVHEVGLRYVECEAAQWSLEQSSLRA